MRCFLHGNGSSGAALNFRVIGGTSQPAGAENDIWVNTDTRITGWMFAATEPENPTEGMVWFATGVTSGAAFNAVRKNGIVLYPIAAQQYIGGAWVKVTAKSYQNGAWQDWWAGQLYDYGTEYPDITGDLVAYALDFFSDTNKAPTIAKSIDNITVTTNATNYSGGLAYWAKRIDLTGYNILRVNGLCTDASRSKIVVLSEIKDSAIAASGALKTVADNVEIDVSGLSDEYFIGFAVSRGSGGNNTMTINQVSLL